MGQTPNPKNQSPSSSMHKLVPKFYTMVVQTLTFTSFLRALRAIFGIDGVMTHHDIPHFLPRSKHVNTWSFTQKWHCNCDSFHWRAAQNSKTDDEPSTMKSKFRCPWDPFQWGISMCRPLNGAVSTLPPAVACALCHPIHGQPSSWCSKEWRPKLLALL